MHKSALLIAALLVAAVAALHPAQPSAALLDSTPKYTSHENHHSVQTLGYNYSIGTTDYIGLNGTFNLDVGLGYTWDWRSLTTNYNYYLSNPNFYAEVGGDQTITLKLGIWHFTFGLQMALYRINFANIQFLLR